MSRGHAAAARVAVVGGGVSGLSAAYFLTGLASAAGRPLSCVLFEAEAELGGKVRTLRWDPPGHGANGSTAAGGSVGAPLTAAGGAGPAPLIVEQGPDSLYAFKPRAIQLARELGLGGSLVGARTGLPTHVLRRGRLRRLPDGLLGLVPARLGPFALSDLLSVAGRVRMALELFVPPRRDGADESVAAFVARRLGREAVEALADPLLAGIHAADPRRLSLLATYPHLREQERRHGSLLRAALARRGAASRGPGGGGEDLPLRPAAHWPSPGDGGARSGQRAAEPLFWSLRGGLAELTATLERQLAGRCSIRRRCPVTALKPEPGEAGFVVEAGERLERFDAVILAVPTWEAARLVHPWSPGLAGALEGVPYASVAVAALVFGPGRIPEASVVHRSTGVLVPAGEGRRLGLTVSACTWFSTKWPHVSPGGRVVVRAFVGRDGSEDPLAAGDGELLAAVRSDLRFLAGVVAEPEQAWVFRWPRAMPQYRVGHLERLADIERRRAAWPGLFLTGAGLGGMGLADCVAQAEQVARACLRWLEPHYAEGGFALERSEAG